VTVDFDDGGVHHGVFHIRFIAAGLEDLYEDIGLAPVAEAPKSRAPVAEMGRQIAPRAARAHNPQNSLDEQAIIKATAPGVRHLAKAMGLNLRPLGVCQNIAIHPKLESHRSSFVNPHTP